MSYQKHNFEPGAVLFASQLNDMDNQIEFLSNQGSSFSDDFKTALLNCFENVAWINENGQTYYDALHDSLYPDNMWFITNTLTGCVTSNNATSILKNNSYVAIITANEGYTLNGATVSITIGGNDVTNLYYSSGSINIPNVTGDLVITVTAISDVVSIDAVFTQGSAIIYDADNLDTLRQYLIVTATYAGSTTAVVTDYTLSGTLTVGTSTITVSYGGKTDTFDVVVTHYDPVRQTVYTDGTSIGKDTYRGTVYKQLTSARAAGAAPIENNNYVFTVTDSEKYNLAAYDVTSLEHITSDVPSSAIDGFMYQAGTKNVAWETSDHVSSEYVWLSLKKMDGTSFTAEELANGAEEVFTYTFSSFNPNTSPDLNLYIDTSINKISNAGSHTYHSTYVPITPNHSYKITKIVSNSFRIGLTADVPAVGVSVLYTAANHSGTTMTVNVTQESARYLVVTYIYDGTAAQNNNIRQSMTITEVVS